MPLSLPASSRIPPSLHAGLALGLVLLAMVLGSFAVVPNLRWYATLHRPSFGPPTWAFAPAWLMLYLTIAWAFFRVLRSADWMPDRPAAIRLFLVQLALNALWPWGFFGLRSPKAGLVLLTVLIGAVVLCGRRFGQVDRTAGWCMVPYGLWLVFAALLNLSVAIRN